MSTVLNLTTAQRALIHQMVDRFIGVEDLPQIMDKGISAADSAGRESGPHEDRPDLAGGRAMRTRADPLELLEGRWEGEGFAVTVQPGPGPTAEPFELRIGTTRERLEFWPVSELGADLAGAADHSAENGTAPARENDPRFPALNYLHEIRDKAGPAGALNYETGIWSRIPPRAGARPAGDAEAGIAAADPVDFVATVVRLATIPGYSVLTMGRVADSPDGAPRFPAIDPIPAARGDDRAYDALSRCAPGTLTDAVRNPDLFLRQKWAALTGEGEQVVDTIELHLSTAERSALHIGTGQVANPQAAARLAAVNAVDTRYWIVTLRPASGSGSYRVLFYSRIVATDHGGAEGRHVATGWLRRQ